MRRFVQLLGITLAASACGIETAGSEVSAALREYATPTRPNAKAMTDAEAAEVERASVARTLEVLRAAVEYVDSRPDRDLVDAEVLSAARWALQTGVLAGLADRAGRITDDGVMLQSSFQGLLDIGSARLSLDDRDNALSGYLDVYAATPELTRAGFMPPSEASYATPKALRASTRALLQESMEQLDPVVSTEFEVPPGWTDNCEDEYGAEDGTDIDGTCTGYAGAGIMGGVEFPLKNYQTCVKNQGNRGTCVAFAIAAAVESEVYLTYGFATNVSEQHLYWEAELETDYANRYSYGVWPSEVMTHMSNTGYLVQLEQTWNYNPSLSASPTLNANNEFAGSCIGYSGELCSDYAFQSNEDIANVGLMFYVTYDAPSSGAGYITRGGTQFWDDAAPGLSLYNAQLLLAGRRPIVAHIIATKSFRSPDANGYVTYAGGEDTTDNGHAVLVVGWVANEDRPRGAPKGAGGGYFVIKNSWGLSWGDCGYVYVPLNFMRDHTRSLTYLQAGLD